MSHADSPVSLSPRRVTGRRALWISAGVLVAFLLGAGTYGLSGGFDNNVTKRLPGGGTKVVRVALVDAVLGFDVTPDTLIVDRGTLLRLIVVNEGDEVHDLALPSGGPRTRRLQPGESQRLELGRVVGNLEAICTLPNHEFAGMTLDIRLSGA